MNKNTLQFCGGRYVLPLIVSVALCLSLIGCGVAKPELIELSDIRYNTLRYYSTGEDLIYNINYDSSSLNVDGSKATCKGAVDERVNEYFRIKGSSTSSWSYDEDAREWGFTGDTRYSIRCVLDTDVEGTWGIYDSRDCIYVDNQTETGMDIYVEDFDAFGDDWVHVELSPYIDEDAQYDLFTSSRGYAIYTGENAEGKEIEVMFFMSFSDELGIQVHASSGFIGGGNERFGYYRDFAPAD